MTAVSAKDVVAQFAGRTSGSRDVWQTWNADTAKDLVRPVVLSHTSAVIFEITPGDILNLRKRTHHALGKVDRTIAESVRSIVNWHPDFAFTHIFHYVVERQKSTVLYQEFQELSRSDVQLRAMLYEPSLDAVAQGARELAARGLEADEALTNARAAMRWRVGNAYYSFMRELYVLAVLRDIGVPVLAHPLADALFRTDAWIGDTLLSLYVSNNEFRDGSTGRKVSPRVLFGGDPNLKFIDIKLRPADRYGVLHLPARADIEDLVRRHPNEFATHR